MPSDKDYERFPGLPRPRRKQTPRTRASLRYPWPCKTKQDVANELRKCPGWAHGPFVVVFEGKMYGWEEALQLVYGKQAAEVAK